MKKSILLLLICFSITILSAQNPTPRLDTPKVPKNSYSAGDALRDAGTLKLFGVGMALVGTGVVLSGRENGSYKRNKVIGGAIFGGIGLLSSILGNVSLIKAGSLLNEQRKISLHPSSEGIGLALRF